MKMAPHPALAVGKACYVGDPVAVIIAESVAEGQDALEQVKVDYETLVGTFNQVAGATQGLIQGRLLFSPDPTDGAKIDCSEGKPRPSPGPWPACTW